MANILLIDDDSDILKIGKKLLATQDHFVLTATNAIEAMDIIKNHELDLIISDAVMPRYSGFDLIKTLKNSRIYRSIPIALLTGKSNKADIQSAIKLGVVDYIVKPLDPVVFLTKVSTILKSFTNEIERSSMLRETSLTKPGSLQFDIEIKKLSEMGLVFYSELELPFGFAFTFHAPIFEEIGIKAPHIKVLKSEANKEFGFVVRAQFCGLGESSLQKIRAWIMKNDLKQAKVVTEKEDENPVS